MFEKLEKQGLIKGIEHTYLSKVNKRVYKTDIFGLTERGSKLLKCLDQISAEGMDRSC